MLYEVITSTRDARGSCGLEFEQQLAGRDLDAGLDVDRGDARRGAEREAVLHLHRLV